MSPAQTVVAEAVRMTETGKAGVTDTKTEAVSLHPIVFVTVT